LFFHVQRRETAAAMRSTAANSLSSLVA
jgi:hypothetical protein